MWYSYVNYQEKAFDRVSHEYLFRVLKTFGLGDRFISFIKLCYIYVSSFINIIIIRYFYSANFQ